MMAPRPSIARELNGSSGYGVNIAMHSRERMSSTSSNSVRNFFWSYKPLGRASSYLLSKQMN
jgi:hypothetical protein